MTTVPGNFSEEEIKEEMLRLAKEEPQDKMDVREKREIQRRESVFGKDSDEKESTSQFSGNEDELLTTSAFSDQFSEVDMDLFDT